MSPGSSCAQTQTPGHICGVSVRVGGAGGLPSIVTASLAAEAEHRKEDENGGNVGPLVHVQRNGPVRRGPRRGGEVTGRGPGGAESGCTGLRSCGQ